MASYNPGTYEGTGRGYGGKLIVNVTVSENRIESVKVTQHKEYRGIAWGLNTTPMERFPKLIVEYQSLNIPTVDGADLTCAGHAHGGIWRLPFTDGLIDTTLTLFPSFTSGFYHCTDENCEGAMVFVNRGLGNSPKIVPRILNRPQVAVITLERG